MRDQSIVVCSAVVGAALGALAGFLFLTDSGRRLRRDLEPRLDNLARDFVTLQSTMARASDAAQQGWRAINDAAGGARRSWADSEQSARY